MAIISKGTVSKGVSSPFTLDKAELELHPFVVADPILNDMANWTKVVLEYGSSESNQSNLVQFNPSEVSPVSGFLVSQFARGNFLIRTIKIHAPDGYVLTIPRSELVAADFDIIFVDLIEGPIYMWGGNTYGQLATGNLAQKSTPTLILGDVDDFIDMGLSLEATLAVSATDGKIWGWGDNTYGTLGDGTTTDRTSPVPMVGPNNSNFKSVRVGYLTTIAIKSDGTLWAAGYNSIYGFGFNHPSTSSPVQVPDHSNFKSIFAGLSAYSYYAIKSDGTVWSWGDSSFYQLGNGSAALVSSITLRSDLSGFIQFANGTLHTVGLKSDGTIWTTGLNNNGQLGLGDTTTRSVFTQVPGYSDFVSIGAGDYNSYGIRSDGSIWGCGLGSGGQLGEGSPIYNPISSFVSIAPAQSNFKKVVGGWAQTIALKSDGTVWGCGNGFYGTMVNTGGSRVSLTQLLSTSDTASVYGGYYHVGLIKKV